MDNWFGVPIGKFRSTGSNRNGRVWCQVRHDDQPFLLGGRGAGHGVCGRVYDPVLLRFQGTLST